jgi:tetratricopeptide (TPR) repeat protein
MCGAKVEDVETVEVSAEEANELFRQMSAAMQPQTPQTPQAFAPSSANRAIRLRLEPSPALYKQLRQVLATEAKSRNRTVISIMLIAAMCFVGLGVGIVRFVPQSGEQASQATGAASPNDAVQIGKPVDKQNTEDENRTRFNRAVSRLDTGETIAALKDFKALLDIDYMPASVHKLMGRCYVALDDYEVARDHYRAAIVLFQRANDAPAAESCRRELNQLKLDP